MIFLYPTGFILEKKNDDVQQLLSTSFSSKKMSLFSLSLNRIVFNKVNGKQINYKLVNIVFLSSNELLQKRITNFYSADVKIKNNNAIVIISYYKSGILYIFNYNKENGKWKEVSNEFGKVKFEPSKPFYIYVENMRLTNPNYKNYDIRLIPRDSLK